MPGCILGFDPGYERCGYAAIEPQGSRMLLLGSGVVRTRATDSFPRRLDELAKGLDALLALWKPAGVAVEELFFNRNVKTAIQVAQARGVILQRCAATNVEVAEYAPTTVKSQLTGNGAADKSQVAFMARRYVHAVGGVLEDSALDDELDAIAVAVCHAMRLSIPAQLQRKAGGRR